MGKMTYFRISEAVQRILAQMFSVVSGASFFSPFQTLFTVLDVDCKLDPGYGLNQNSR